MGSDEDLSLVLVEGGNGVDVDSCSGVWVQGVQNAGFEFVVWLFDEVGSSNKGGVQVSFVLNVLCVIGELVEHENGGVITIFISLSDKLESDSVVDSDVLVVFRLEDSLDNITLLSGSRRREDDSDELWTVLEVWVSPGGDIESGSCVESGGLKLVVLGEIIDGELDCVDLAVEVGKGLWTAALVDLDGGLGAGGLGSGEDEVVVVHDEEAVH